MSFSSIWDNFTSSGDGFGDLMHDIESHFTNVMKSSAKAPNDIKEHISAFIAAINWKEEKWIFFLLAFHIVLLLAVVLTRKRQFIQFMLFVIICSLTAVSEAINSLCSNNWRRFSSQNYFDEHGVFIGIFFSGPLLIIGFIQLICFLIETSSLLIKVKRMELARKKQSTTKQQAQEKELQQHPEQKKGDSSAENSNSKSSVSNKLPDKFIAEEYSNSNKSSHNNKKNAKRKVQ